MSKIDLRKELKHLYNPSAREVLVVKVPPISFLLIDGAGDPNISPQYQQAVEALFSLSYALKFTIKKSNGLDYAVMPLEGLWWAQDPSQFSMSHKDIWEWTAMIRQPEQVTSELVAQARAEVAKKKGLPALERVRFETYDEGLSAQLMHLGPYAAEEPTIARLHNFIRENGYEPNGKHHEIYLNDLRKTAAERLKTVLRQPVRQQGQHASA
jgi:hypothetical protein